MSIKANNVTLGSSYDPTAVAREGKDPRSKEYTYCLAMNLDIEKAKELKLPIVQLGDVEGEWEQCFFDVKISPEQLLALDEIVHLSANRVREAITAYEQNNKE